MPENTQPSRHRELQFRRPLASTQLTVVLVGVWTFAVFLLGQDPLGYVQAFRGDGTSRNSRARLGHHTSGLEALYLPADAWMNEPALIDNPDDAQRRHQRSELARSTEPHRRIFVPRGARLTDFHTETSLQRAYSPLVDSHARLMRALALCVFGLATACGLLYHLRQLGGKIRHSRELAVLVIWCIAALSFQRLSLAFVPVSAGWLAIPAFVLPLSMQLGRSVATAAGITLALALGTLVPPFDPVISTVAAAQALAVSAFMPRQRAGSWAWSLWVSASTCVLGTIAYVTAQCVCFGGLDPLDLRSLEWGRLGGVVMTGFFAPFFGQAINPLLERACGNLSRSKLLELSDLRNPMLQRIATRAPGTWAHSRMMANLAESAAHAVGADALLVRVGAYYHDLGKADEPEYFIENHSREPGTTNIHDSLAPELSASKIIAHVVEGVRRARAQGLPESIIDFMHTHHGSGRVEYFYQRALSQAEDPATVDPAIFTYPGDVPRTIETGILAIVDAVEAAARTLRSPDEAGVNAMLRQIVFTKLGSGQLDACGMTSKDIRLICDDLRDSLLAASHERVAYPWQEQANKEEDTSGSMEAPSAAKPESESEAPAEEEPPAVAAVTTPQPQELEPDATQSGGSEAHAPSENGLVPREARKTVQLVQQPGLAEPLRAPDSESLEELARRDGAPSQLLDVLPRPAGEDELATPAEVPAPIRDVSEVRRLEDHEPLTVIHGDGEPHPPRLDNADLQSPSSAEDRLDAVVAGATAVGRNSESSSVGPLPTPPRETDDITRPLPDPEPERDGATLPPIAENGGLASDTLPPPPVQLQSQDVPQTRTPADSEEREAAALDDKLNDIIDDVDGESAIPDAIDRAVARTEAELRGDAESVPVSNDAVPPELNSHAVPEAEPSSAELGGHGRDTGLDAAPPSQKHKLSASAHGG